MSENPEEIQDGTGSTVEMGTEEAAPSGDAVRVAVDVLVGILPGTPMPEHTRRFFIGSAQWNAPDANKAELLSDLAGRATGWATLWMLSPDAVNWVKLEWVWF